MSPRQLAVALAAVASVSVCLAAGQAIPPGPSAQSGTGLIMGRVIDADSGTPIASALVTLGSGTPAVNLLGGGTAERRVLTDAQGRFVFRNLAKSSYTLAAAIGGTGTSLAGFLVSGFGQPIGPYVSGGYGQRRPGGPTDTIELAEGERVGDVVIRLWRGGAIDGTVFDEAGEPLVGIVVSAVRRSTDGRLLTGPTARTDDRGLYHLGTLEPGSYLVVVPQVQTLLPVSTIEDVLGHGFDPVVTGRLSSTGAPSPGGSGTGPRAGTTMFLQPTPMSVTNGVPPLGRSDGLYAYETTFYPGVGVASRATPVAVRSGEDRTGVDLRLQPVRTVSVTGTVVDPAGPVPHFGVHLMPADAGDGAAVLEVAATATDARGTFVFPSVPSGSYTLVAQRGPSAPAGRGTPDPPPPVRVSETIGAWVTQSLAVGDVDIGGLVLSLRPAVQVKGRVEFQGSSPLPFDRIRRTVSPVRTPPQFRTPGPSLSGSFAGTGEFAIAGIAPGRYLWRVSDEGYVDWSLQSILMAGREVADDVVPLDSDISNILIVLTDRPAELTGSVRGLNGGFDPEASVFIFPADRKRWPNSRASTRAFRTVRVSKTGGYRIPRMIPGDYLVVALPDARAADWPDEPFLERLASLASPIRIETGRKSTLDLKTAEIR